MALAVCRSCNCLLGSCQLSDCQVPAADIDSLLKTAVQHSSNLLSLRAQDSGSHAGIQIQAGTNEDDLFLQGPRRPRASSSSAKTSGPGREGNSDASVADPVHVLDSTSEGEEAEPFVQQRASETAAALAAQPHVWDLGGSLLVPGLKHICSNIQGDVLSRLAHYAEFQALLLLRLRAAKPLQLQDKITQQCSSLALALIQN